MKFLKFLRKSLFSLIFILSFAPAAFSFPLGPTEITPKLPIPLDSLDFLLVTLGMEDVQVGSLTLKYKEVGQNEATERQILPNDTVNIFAYDVVLQRWGEKGTPLAQFNIYQLKRVPLRFTGKKDGEGNPTLRMPGKNPAIGDNSPDDDPVESELEDGAPVDTILYLSFSSEWTFPNGGPLYRLDPLSDVVFLTPTADFDARRVNEGDDIYDLPEDQIISLNGYDDH